MGSDFDEFSEDKGLLAEVVVVKQVVVFQISHAKKMIQARVRF